MADKVVLNTAWNEHAGAGRSAGGASVHMLAVVPERSPLAPVAVPGLHRLHGEHGVLDLLAGPLEHWLPELSARVNEFVLPQPFPGLRALQRLAAPQATLSVHGADEATVRELRAAGFSAHAAPDADGWLHADYTSRKPQPPAPPPPQRQAIVIGAGVAGSAACERLAARGWQVTLVERHDEPAQEASGNRSGIFMPLLSKDDNIPTRLARAAYLYAIRSWQRLGGMAPQQGAKPVWGAQCGVLQLARDAEHAQLQQDVAAQWAYPDNYVRWLDAAQASATLGAPTPYGAWLFPQGGWANPGSVCRAMLDACGDRLRRIFHSEALELRRAGGQWQVWGSGGLLAEAPHVVLANGAGATAIAQAAALPLYTMRGQVTHLAQETFPNLPLVVCREAYLTPPVEGIVSAGATYDKDGERALRQSSQDENLARAAEILGRDLGRHPLQGRVGLRTMAPDRLPLVGTLPDYGAAQRAERLRDVARHDGLHTLLGYASRGLIWAPLAAELLACQLEGEPLPMEATLAAALDPARFLLKAQRKL